MGQVTEFVKDELRDLWMKGHQGTRGSGEIAMSRQIQDNPVGRGI